MKGPDGACRQVEDVHSQGKQHRRKGAGKDWKVHALRLRAGPTGPRRPKHVTLPGALMGIFMQPDETLDGKSNAV